ncbi:MAG: hypothetical protein SGPRY_000920 [Prymnesium sp.]
MRCAAWHEALPVTRGVEEAEGGGWLAGVDGPATARRTPLIRLAAGSWRSGAKEGKVGDSSVRSRLELPGRVGGAPREGVAREGVVAEGVEAAAKG